MLKLKIFLNNFRDSLADVSKLLDINGKVKWKQFLIKMTIFSQAVVVHAYNPSTWEAEGGRLKNSRPAWSIECVPGQPGLQRETQS